MERWEDFSDPARISPWGIDWTPYFSEDGEAIDAQSVVWTVPGELTTVKTDTVGDVTRIWLTGGVEGEDYEVRAEVDTTSEQHLVLTVVYRVRRL